MRYKSNKNQIEELVIKRLYIDLYKINDIWIENKYDKNNRSLSEWIKWKTNNIDNNSSGLCLQIILENCTKCNPFYYAYVVYKSLVQLVGDNVTKEITTYLHVFYDEDCCPSCYLVHKA